MGFSVLIIGSPGSGKSTSIGNIPEAGIKGLKASETMIINSLGKELPFKGSAKQYSIWNKSDNPDGHMVITSDPKAVYQWLQHINKSMPHIKNIVIDDNTHISSMEYLRRISETTWDKWNDIGYFMAMTAKDVKSFREDLCVFFLHHSRQVGDSILTPITTEAMTLGSIIDNKVSGYESLFTIVLQAVKKVEGEDIKYCFLTRSGASSAKTPFGLFAEKEIPNDLGYVREKIDCFYKDDCKDTETPVLAKKAEKTI